MKQEKLYPLVMMFDFGTLISYIVRFMEISGWLEKNFFPLLWFCLHEIKVALTKTESLILGENNSAEAYSLKAYNSS